MAPYLREEPFQSNFRSFCQGNSIVNVYTQIADGILDVRVAQQHLYCAQVARRLVDQRGLRSAHRMRPVFMDIQSNCGDPLVN